MMTGQEERPLSAPAEEERTWTFRLPWIQPANPKSPTDMPADHRLYVSA
jgi:hypothetical protein